MPALPCGAPRRSFPPADDVSGPAQGWGGIFGGCSGDVLGIQGSPRSPCCLSLGSVCVRVPCLREIRFSPKMGVVSVTARFNARERGEPDLRGAQRRAPSSPSRESRLENITLRHRVLKARARGCSPDPREHSRIRPCLLFLPSVAHINT